MAHCEKCIHYNICNAYTGEETITFFPHNEDCEYFKDKADMAEVRHGEWQFTEGYDTNYSPIYECSVCHKEVADYYIGNHKYCLHCGAKMKRKDE